MALPLVLIGMGLQMAGQWQANQDEAKAELKNAGFYRDQANFARDAMFRELDIAERTYSFKMGEQISMAARGGADVGSGSIVNTLASTAAMRIDELLAIKKKGELDIKLASLRGTNSQDKADPLGSTRYNMAQAASTGISSYAKYGNHKTGDDNSVIKGKK